MSNAIWQNGHYRPRPDKYKHKKPKSRNPWSPNYDDSLEKEDTTLFMPQDYSQGYVNPYVQTPDAPVFDTPSAQDNAENLQDFMDSNKPPHLQNRWKRQPSSFTFSQPIEKCSCEPKQEGFEFDINENANLPHSRGGLGFDGEDFLMKSRKHIWEITPANARKKSEGIMGRKKPAPTTIDYNLELNVNDTDKTLTVYAHLLIFGDKANPEIAAKIADEISTEWNKPQAQVEVDIFPEETYGISNKFDGNNLYKVIFSISHKYYNIKKDRKELENISSSSQNVYIYVGSSNSKKVGGIGRNTSTTIGNSTLLLIEQIDENIKVAAHEFGHNCGLNHPESYRKKEGNKIISHKVEKINIRIDNGPLLYGYWDYRPFEDIEGNKVSMMMPSASLVSKEYQKDPTVLVTNITQPSEQIARFAIPNKKAFLDGAKRKVTRQDVINLLAFSILKKENDTGKFVGNIRYRSTDNENILNWKRAPFSDKEKQ